MRVKLTLLLLAFLGCRRSTETSSQSPHTTTHDFATAPQTPAAPNGQHRTASANDPTGIDSTPNGQTGQAAETSSVEDNDSPPKQSGQPAKQAENHDLAIVDENGNPIKHATVEPISLSINYGKFDADENGHADIPWKLQPVKWVAITKPGYVDSGHIDVDQPKPIIITLKKPTD